MFFFNNTEAYNATKTMKASTKEENLIVLYPERIKGAKDHSTKFITFGFRIA